MTIAKRIALLVVVAIIGLLALGAFSLMKMSTINSNLEYANNKSIPALSKIDAINAAFLRVRIMYVTLNFVAPEEQKPAVLKGYNLSRDELNQLLKDYDSLTLNDKDREFHETTKRIVAEYFGLLDRATALLQENKVAEAKAQSATAREVTVRLTANINDHLKLHTELAAEEAKRGASAYSQGIIQNLVIVAFVALGVGAIGFVTLRHVTASLAEMHGAFDRVAQTLDFTGRLPISGNDELGQTSKAFNRLLDRLQQSLREILAKTDAVNAAAERVSSASSQMSANSSHQSGAASDMAATMEQMTVSINHVADRAGDAESLSRTSEQRARQGTDIIEGAVSEINEIAAAVDAASGHITRLEQNSERINSVLSVIKEVADQTNLLALNAAIEAARAGEQGRGFAVVADEVRKLAERTTQSTQEISVTINEMQTGARQAVEGVHAVVTKTESGVNQAQRANQAIREIGESSLSAVGMVGEISLAIREQSAASNNIARQVEKIAQMAEENNSASRSTSATASELASLAREMRNVVGQYRV